MAGDIKVGDLKFGVVIEGQEFVKGTQKLQKETEKVGESAAKGSQGVKKFNESLEDGSKKAQGFGASLAKYLTLTAVIAGVIKFTKALFKLGSDLEEVQSKFNVVFAESAPLANKNIEALADELGRSSLELKTFSATLGSIFKPLGFTADEARRMAENITRLGVDVASFNNVSDDQAINAFSRAITGEREALKTLGIVISEADVATEAYNTGIARQGEELTKQQKALATYQLFLKNTADAQGDAVRTGDSFANQLKRLRGTITDTFATAGREVSKNTAGLLVDLTKFVETYGKAIVDTTIKTATTILSTIALATKGFTDLFNALNNSTESATKRELGILDFLGVGIRTILLGVSNAIKGVVSIVQAAGIVIGDTLGFIVLTTKTVGSLLINIFKAAGLAIAGGFTSVSDSVVSTIQGIANGAIGIINKLISAVNKIPKVDIPLLSKLAPAERQADKLKVLFKDTVSEIGTDIGQFSTNATAAFDNTFAEAGAKITDFTSGFSDDFGNLGADIIKSQEKTTESVDGTINKYEDLNDLVSKYGKDSEEANEKASGSAEATNEDIKTLEKGLDKIDNEYTKWQDSIEKTEDKLADLQAKHTEVLNQAKDEIEATTEELKNLTTEFDKATAEDKSEFYAGVAEKVVDAREEIKKLNEELATEDSAERAEKLRAEIEALKEVEATGLQVLSEAAATGVGSEFDFVEEETRKRGLNAVELSKEQFDKEQAERLAAFEAEKAVLEERNALLEQFRAGEDIKLEEIKDFKNLQLIEELEAKQDQIDEEIALVNQEQEAIKQAWINGAIAIEQVNEALIARLDAKYQALAARIQAALAAASGGAEGGAQAGGFIGGAQAGGFIDAIRGFAKGGFTGLAPTNRVAGVVHGGEWVANARMVRDFQPVFDALDHIQRKGFQEGGPVTNNHQKTLTQHVTVNHRVGLRAIMNEARWYLR